jgi:hypothetical protein
MCEKLDLIHCHVCNLRESWAQINIFDVAPVLVKWFLTLLYELSYLPVAQIVSLIYEDHVQRFGRTHFAKHYSLTLSLFLYIFIYVE